MVSEKRKYPPFYPVPMALFEKPFAGVRIEAKMLYGMILSRADLSKRNGWIDDDSRIYVYFTIKEVMSRISCGEQKAIRIMVELEKHGLIERKSYGCGKPYRIFPKLVEIRADTSENQC